MSRTSFTWNAALSLGLALALSGCSSSGGGGGGSSSGAVGSTSAAASATTVGTGPLATKAVQFENIMQANHVPFGQVQDVTFDAAGGIRARTGPSRCLWTGVYAASQAMRFRATGDPQALANVETSLRALHDLHAVTGIPGVVARGYDTAQYQANGFPSPVPAYAGLMIDPGTTSRDQYTGWFYGLAFGWDLVRDAQLKADLQADAAAICDRLMAGNLAMEAFWNGKQETFFNLNPDYAYFDQITPQTWATVDDFPANLITQAIPYDPQIAAALQAIKLPPVRGGEANRAVMFFTVTANITGEPRFEAYKRDMLYGQRDFAHVILNYTNLLDDALHGNNLRSVEVALYGVMQAAGQLVDIYMQTQNMNFITRMLVTAAVGSVGNWLSDRVVDVIDYLTDPSNQASLSRLTGYAHTAAMVANLLGLSGMAGQIVSAVQTYAPVLTPQGLEEAADSIRSYTGLNLGTLALAGSLATETDPATRDIYQQVLDGKWRYINDEQHALVNLIHVRDGLAPGPSDVGDALLSLSLFPTDLRLKKIDNSGWPGLRISPWPDRFGKVGNLAAGPVFPIDHRERHLFVWQSNPRTIVDSVDAPDTEVAPLGYLAPYWLARDLGVIGPND